MEEITTRKVGKNRYETSDREGNVAYGYTKKMAENQYHLLYGINRSPINCAPDMSQFKNNV